MIAAVVLSALVLAALAPGTARKNGVSGRAETGCNCHGGGSPDGSVVAGLDGVPAKYEPGKKYALTAKVSGGPPYSKAGFNLNVTQGTLSASAGESNVQISTKSTFGAISGEATHKNPGTRSWKIDWTAPAAGQGRVTFRLAVNSVNGNDQPDALDKWNRATRTSDEKNVPPAAVVLQPPVQVGPVFLQVDIVHPPINGVLFQDEIIGIVAEFRRSRLASHRRQEDQQRQPSSTHRSSFCMTLDVVRHAAHQFSFGELIPLLDQRGDLPNLQQGRRKVKTGLQHDHPGLVLVMVQIVAEFLLQGDPQRSGLDLQKTPRDLRQLSRAMA
ncbi:MAG: hypothetical protein HYU26_10205, partial [Candidatus Rokubacteria bacterium]|nr:hypothetical protein [Candidatus Rokubacteria bacterium]